MRSRDFILATLLILAPLGARAADLVVWWEKGYYAQEDEAVREIIAAFEQESGKQVELVFHPLERASGQDRGGARGGPAARLRLRRVLLQDYIAEWAFDDRLVDLSDTIGHFSNLFDPDALAWVTLAQREDRAEGLVRRCRSAARPTTSTSGRAFWSRRASRSRTSRASGKPSGPSGATRCSRPCARPRAATTSGASGLPMSVEAADTDYQFFQFVAAYEADYVTRDGRLVIDDPEIRQQARQGHRQLHGDLSQGLHPARFGDLGPIAATTSSSSPRRSS